jgi:hypothetical protein
MGLSLPSINGAPGLRATDLPPSAMGITTSAPRNFPRRR